MLNAGTETFSVTFTPADTTVYASATESVSLTVAKAVPVITWPFPSTLLYSTPLFVGAAQRQRQPAGTFAYNPPVGTTLPVGQATLSRNLYAVDPANVAAATLTRTLTVTATAPAPAPTFVQGHLRASPPTYTQTSAGAGGTSVTAGMPR